MSAAVSLEQTEPDFADGGETGDGMPESADRDLAGDGDGGRVNQFLHVRADEGDAEEAATVLIDDHPAPAPVAVGVQVRAHDLFARVDVDHLDAVPGTFGLLSTSSGFIRPFDASPAIG